MKVLTQTIPLAPSKILLKDAVPLERYLTSKNLVIEVCASEKVLKKTGKLAQIKSADGRIYVYWLDKDGDRRKNKDGVDEYSDVPLDPGLEVEWVSRTGPKRRNDGLWWRGWGRKNPDKMSTLISMFKDEGFYVAWPKSRKHHYLTVGFENTKLCVLLFSGHVGFSEKLEGALAFYPVISKKEGYVDKHGIFTKTYMRHRLDLAAIEAKEKWSEFEIVFRRQLKEWKHLLLYRARTTR